MEPGDDPYVILGLATTNENDQQQQQSSSSSSVNRSSIDARHIRLAYRQAALKHHPDKQRTAADKERATREFTRIAAAYELLSDPDQRAAYDAAVIATAAAASSSSTRQQQQQRSSSTTTASNNSPSSFNPFSEHHFHNPFAVFESVFQFDDGMGLFDSMSRNHHQNHHANHHATMREFASGDFCRDLFRHHHQHAASHQAMMMGGFPSPWERQGTHQSSFFSTTQNFASGGALSGMQYSHTSGVSSSRSGAAPSFTSFASSSSTTTTRMVNGQRIAHHIEERQHNNGERISVHQSRTTTTSDSTKTTTATSRNTRTEPVTTPHHPLAVLDTTSSRSLPMSRQPIVIDLDAADTLSPPMRRDSNESAFNDDTKVSETAMDARRGDDAPPPREVIDLVDDETSDPTFIAVPNTKRPAAAATDLPDVDLLSSNSSSSSSFVSRRSTKRRHVEVVEISS